VPEPHHLSRQHARRICVQAQLLAAPRPTVLLDVVRHLTLVQIEPTAAVAPSADLVLWSRLGSSYDVEDLRDALDTHQLLELHQTIRPVEDLVLHRAEMADWPGRGELRPWQHGLAGWMSANDACRRDILERLRADGPLAMKELPDTTEVPWGSSGWTNNRNVERMLHLMTQRGEVAVSGREGRLKLWDLASRVYPDEPVVPAEEADRIRRERRLRALGLARAKAAGHPLEDQHVGDAGEPAVVEGVKGQWRVDPALLDRSFEGRAALLSPFDRLVADRKRTTEIFGFDYLLEMYKPAAQRRWGYYALPILYGDRLVGKLDSTAERDRGVLRVDAVHEDVPFTRTMAAAVHREVRGLARWLGLELELSGGSALTGT